MNPIIVEPLEVRTSIASRLVFRVPVATERIVVVEPDELQEVEGGPRPRRAADVISVVVPKRENDIARVGGPDDKGLGQLYRDLRVADESAIVLELRVGNVEILVAEPDAATNPPGRREFEPGKTRLALRILEQCRIREVEPVAPELEAHEIPCPRRHLIVARDISVFLAPVEPLLHIKGVEVDVLIIVLDSSVCDLQGRPVRGLDKERATEPALRAPRPDVDLRVPALAGGGITVIEGEENSLQVEGGAACEEIVPGPLAGRLEVMNILGRAVRGEDQSPINRQIDGGRWPGRQCVVLNRFGG